MAPLGVMAPMAFPGPGGSGVTLRGEAPAEYLLPHLERVIAEGFAAIELTRIKDAGVRAAAADLVAPLDVTFAGHVVQLQNEAGLNPYDIGNPREPERRDAVNRLLGFLPEAHELGAARFAVLSGACPVLRDQREDRGAHRDALVRSLSELATATDLTIVVVAFDRRPSPDGFEGAFKSSLIGPVRESTSIVEEVRAAGPENVRLGLDTAHLVQNGEGPGDLDAALGHVDMFHISNCVLDVDAPDAATRFGDRHPAFGIAGSVVTEPVLAQYAAVLRDGDYDGPLTFEVRPTPDEDPWEVLLGARQVWESASAAQNS